MNRRNLLAAGVFAALASSSARAQSQLEIRYREGISSRARTIRAQQVLSIAGQEVPTKSEAAATIRTEVGGLLPDGTRRIRETITGMVVRVELPGAMVVTFDSARPEEAKSDVPQIQAMLAGFRAMVGASHTLVAGKDGRIASVEGVDAILAAAPAEALDGLKSYFNAEKLKKEANQELDVAPGKPVKKGDTWKRVEEMRIGGGQTLIFETHYEYLGTLEKNGKTLDQLGVFMSGVTYTMDANNPQGLTVERSDLKIESSTGSVLIDREQGRVVQRSTVTQIKGPITFSVNGMQLPAGVDLTLDSGTALK